MGAIFDYGPDTPVEIEAKRRLEELQAEYQRRAEPYLRVLVEAQALKMPRVMIVPDGPQP